MHGGDSRDSGLTAGCWFYLAGYLRQGAFATFNSFYNYYLAHLLKSPVGKICGSGCGRVCGMLGMRSGVWGWMSVVYMLGPPPVFSASL